MFADFHNAWDVRDIVGNPINNGVTHAIYSATSTAMFSANIGYKDIYPACDLVLYKKRLDGGADNLAIIIEKEQGGNIEEYNGKFSLHFALEQ